MADDVVEHVEMKPAALTDCQASRRVQRRAAGLGLLALLLAAGIVAACAWWRDRPLARAEAGLRAGSAEMAFAAADAFLDRHPGDERAQAIKARALVQLGQWEEAGRIFSRIGMHSREDMQAWAKALVHLQRWNESLPLLTKLLESSPANPALLRDMTTCQFQLGQSGAALATAERLATIPGHETEGWFLSGVIQRGQGNTRLAIQSWARIEQMHPSAEGLPIEPAEFFLIYGEDLVSEDAPRTALAKLYKSRELEEGLAVLLELGKALAILGEESAAEEMWKRALTHDANNGPARQGLAELALIRGNATEALSWLAPIASGSDVSSATAFLMERACTLEGNDEEVEFWQARAAALRQREKRQASLQRSLRRQQ